MTGRSMSWRPSSSNTRREAWMRLTPGAMSSSSITAAEPCRWPAPSPQATHTSSKCSHTTTGRPQYLTELLVGPQMQRQAGLLTTCFQWFRCLHQQHGSEHHVLACAKF